MIEKRPKVRPFNEPVKLLDNPKFDPDRFNEALETTKEIIKKVYEEASENEKRRKTVNKSM